MTMASLFDGSGGFPLAATMCGIEPIWASEVAPFPIRVTTKRFPGMKHYGDVSKINGAEVPPVDIITFGSPCQDLSLAGKRAGIEGERSGLFYQAVRIIKEMREKTNGRQPRYIIWENVYGAFSSNNGEDFRCVLGEIGRIKRTDFDVPRCDEWLTAGEIMADDFSIAWRGLDAQYWGVPQRRKRIFLVADFNGGGASKVLFDSEGVSRYSAANFKAWQRTAGSIEESTHTAGLGCDGYNGTIDNIAATMGVNCGMSTGRNGVLMAAGFCAEEGAATRSIGYGEELSPTLRAGVVSTAMAMRVRQGKPGGGKGALIQNEKSGTIACGNDQTLFVMATAQANAEITENQAPTITAAAGTSGNNKPILAYGIGRDAFNMGENAQFGMSISEEQQPPMLARGPGAVAMVDARNGTLGETAPAMQAAYDHTNNAGGLVFTTSKASYHRVAECEVANTLVATDYKDPPTVTEGDYIVRRLTPTECARLQGFPDWWCSDLEEDTEGMDFWREVWNTWTGINGAKQKTDKEIAKWLKQPYSESEEYKMWGNGVALPCVFFVMAGIQAYDEGKIPDEEPLPLFAWMEAEQ